jgi:uncharacterized RDD family membrane protein YckC
MQSLEGVELASFLLRACALTIDLILALIVLFILLATIVIPASQRAGVKNLNLEFGPETWYAVIYLALFFGLTLYFGKGRTLGKRLMGIRVVSLVHHHISLFHSVERAMGYVVSTGEFFFGFFQYFIHPNRRTAHDRLAETIVIQERRDKAANLVFEHRLRVGLMACGASVIVAAAALHLFAPADLFKGVKAEVHFGTPKPHE